MKNIKKSDKMNKCVKCGIAFKYLPYYNRDKPEKLCIDCYEHGYWLEA